MFRVISGVVMALFLAVFLLVPAEKVEAKAPPCWAGEWVFMGVDCSYSDYYCGSYHTHISQAFGRNGKITNFNLFWPGGEVIQTISKEGLKVMVNYPEEGFFIKIHFHFVCDGNGCVALSPSGLMEVKYKGMGTIQACGMSAPADYCYREGSGLTTEKESSAETLEDVVNKIVINLITNPPGH